MTIPSLVWTRQAAREALQRSESRQTWDQLNARRGDLPFLSARAVLAALAQFGNGNEVLVTGRVDGATAAMFVLVPDGKLRWSTFQPSQVPLGCWVAREDLPLEDLVASLLQRGLGLALVLSVTQVDPRVAPRPTDSPTLRTADYIDTAWLDVTGTFEDYWAARGKNLRQNLRKQRNKLQNDGVQAELVFHRLGQDMPEALRRYGALESAGWKAEGGTAIDADNAQGRFYLQLLTEAADAGEALIAEYRFNGATVAMNLCLLRHGVLVVLKTCYDESIRTLSPASLLREAELQTFFGQTEVRRLEYFGRVMEWHTKLTDQKRTIYHLTRFRWAWLRTLAERRQAASAATVAPEPGVVADAEASK